MYTAPSRRPWLALAVAGLVCSALLAAQTPSPGGVVAAYAEATAAMSKKDYVRAIAHLERALGAAPRHPGLLAGLARAEYLAGRRKEALEHLTAALRGGGGLDVADDPAVTPLLSGADGAPARQAAAALRIPVSTSEVAFRLGQRDLIPEGIAHDPVGNHFYVGSIYRRTIVRVDEAGRATTFVPDKQDGLLSVLGMKVDAARRVLWAATEGNLNMQDAQPGDVGRSALVAYDLRTGRLRRRFDVAPDPIRHLFNDVALGADGEVYVTDSEEGSVYALATGSERLERLIGPRALDYPNGVALAGDGRRLFVAHVAGIAVVDIASRRVTPLPHPPDTTVADIDGLYRVGHGLVAVQNGLSPARIAHFMLDDREQRVVGLRLLERGHPLFASIPTTGTMAGEWFYYIANAQLRAYTPDNRLLPLDRLQETVVLRTRLGASR